MAVEAARSLRESDFVQVEELTLATTTPPFAEPQNAALVHAALRLPRLCRTIDSTGTPRAALVALHGALESGQNALIAAADRPVAQSGSTAESRAGDGGAAAQVGPGEGIFNYRSGASISVPFIHRSRVSGAAFPLDWEDRWLREEGFLKLLPEAIGAALAQAQISAESVRHLILPCPLPGVAQAIARASGLTNATLAPGLNELVGDTGAAHALLMLCAAANKMLHGEPFVVAQFGQGATALVFTAGEKLPRQNGLQAQIDAGLTETSYTKMLAFQDRLDWDRGLRGRYIVPEFLTTAYRNADALLGFVASRDLKNGQVTFPGKLREGSEEWPLADRGGRVASVTSDLLAFSRHPPSCYGMVDFDGGGRLMMDFTDPDAAEISTGDLLRFVFRLKDIDTQTGFRRYFWKAVRVAAQL